MNDSFDNDNEKRKSLFGEKTFNSNDDEVGYLVEKTLFTGIVFVLCYKFSFVLINMTGPTGQSLIWIFPILIFSTLGAGIYSEMIYLIGRSHWLPRVLLDAGVLLLFYVVFWIF